MPQGVLFDLDETLIDRASSIEEYAHRLYDQFASRLTMKRDVFVKQLIQFDDNGSAPRDVFFSKMAKYTGEPSIGSDTLSSHFNDHAWENPRIMPGALEGLRSLRECNVPIGIVTNGGSNVQRQKLFNTHLDQMVDGFIISDGFGARKPHASIFHAACHMLHIDPSESWFVGDNPVLDIAGASSLGFKTIWLKRSTPWPEGLSKTYTVVCSSLQEAFDVLRSAA